MGKIGQFNAKFLFYFYCHTLPNPCSVELAFVFFLSESLITYLQDHWSGNTSGTDWAKCLWFPFLPFRPLVAKWWFTMSFSHCDKQTSKQTKQKYDNRGGSRIFFRRGCTRPLLYFNTNKPHSFFLRNTSCIRKPQVISGRGVRTPCTLPLDPPLDEQEAAWPSG